VTTAAAKIVRSLDLGSGYAKYSRLSKESGDMEFDSFPSLAPRHAGVDLSASLSFLGRRETVVVDVDGSKYEVGPDSGDLDTNDSTRNLNDSFIHTEQYKAVFLGALHYIGEPVIDVLVVGLPLNNMQAAGKLKALMEGKHRINATETVEVKEARVIPQTQGGLLYCLSLAKDIPALEFMSEEVNLVIDPGFLTYDWVLANGDKIIENRSSAHNGGVSKVLRSIGESISTKFNIKYDNLGALDKGLRRRKLKINGEVESMEDHIKNTKSVLEGSVNFMKNIVGDGSDIDNIILLGGGSHIYQKTIAAYYPKHTVVVLEDAQAANVRGYQIAGERLAGVKSKTK
jgi:plasmid segregation protein ParM